MAQRRGDSPSGRGRLRQHSRGRLRPRSAAEIFTALRPPCRGIYPAERGRWERWRRASRWLGRSACRRPCKQTYQGISPALALPNWPVMQPEQAMPSCYAMPVNCAGGAPVAGAVVPNGNAGFTDLEQERFGFCLRPPAMARHGLTAAGRTEARLLG